MHHQAREAWLQEIEAATTTLQTIRQCVAPSPRRQEWERKTEAGLLLMVKTFGHQARTRPLNERED